MSDCLAPADLLAYLDGRLAAGDAEASERHFTDCTACRDRMLALAEGESETTPPRTVLIPPASDADPVEERLLGRIRRAFQHQEDSFLKETPPNEKGSRPAEAATPRFPFRVGPYEVRRRVGAGGMGVVYEARDTRLGRRVALKMLLPSGGAWNLGERMRREAEVLAALNHPNILPIYEVGEHEGQPYLALEYVDGGPLSDRTRATPQPPRDAAALARTLAAAAQYAHERGVVHRDLKPSNVLIVARSQLPVAREDKDGPSSLATGNWQLATIPKIADFGLARREDHGLSLTGTGQPLGTPGYMAPEQAAGVKEVGPAADVYGLGAILYELLTGRPPFQADSVALTLRLVQEAEPVAPRTLQPGVPRDLETICLKCLEKEPARRYASAAALEDDLGRFLDGRPIAARPLSPVGRAGRWVKRHRGYALLGGLAVTLLLALAGGGIVYALTEARLRREVEDQQTRADAARTRAMERFRKAIDVFDSASRDWAVHEGQPELRRANFRALMELCEAYLEYLPDASPQQPHDVYVLFRLAWMHGSLGESAEGEKYYDAALAAVERLRARFPDNDELRSCEYLSRLNRCFIRGNAGRWQEAAGDAAWAYAFAKARLPAAPGEAGGLKEYLDAANNLQLCQFQSGQKEESLATRREHIAVRRRLLPPRPESPVDTRDLAQCLTDLGEVLNDIGRPSEALAPLGEAIDLHTSLTRNPPFAAQAGPGLRKALGVRARVFQRLGRRAEAEADRKEADRYPGAR